MDLDPTLSDTFFSDRPPGKGPYPLLRFYTEERQNPAKSAAEGRPIFDMHDLVGITNPGSRDETVRAVKDKLNDDFIAWAYRKWKATQEQVVEGTPLETIPFLNKAQVQELKALNIHTLEHLVDLPDTAKQRFMGAETLQRQARAYVASAKDTAHATHLQKQLDQRDAQIAALQKQMVELNARFEAAQRERV